MKSITATALLIGACVWGSSSPTFAYSTAGSKAMPSASAMTDMGPTLAPMAFVEFCATYERQCHDAPSPASITLDARSWETLRRVNAEVNSAIEPDAGKGGFGWSLETRFGNCNDYAVQKRDALLKMGYPMAALSLAAARTAFGEGHLVLTVRTDRGDFVLDNRREAIVAWNRTGYSWVKRQSAENPRYWVAVSASPRLLRTVPGTQPEREPVRKTVPRADDMIAANRASPPVPAAGAEPAADSAPSEEIGLSPTIDPTLWRVQATMVEPLATSMGEIVFTLARATPGLTLLAFDPSNINGWQLQ